MEIARWTPGSGSFRRPAKQWLNSSRKAWGSRLGDPWDGGGGEAMFFLVLLRVFGGVLRVFSGFLLGFPKVFAFFLVIFKALGLTKVAFGECVFF